MRLSLPAISLRAKIVTYLVLVHAALAAIALLVLAENRLALIAVEALFALSVVFGVLLVRSFFVPLRMIRTGAELIQEEDFSVRFREIGQPEMDELIRIYNRMIDRLREERLRVREQHTFLTKVLAASPAGVVTLGFDGEIALVNPSAARILDVQPEQASGKSLRALDNPLAIALGSLAAGTSEVLAVQGRRLKCSRAEFYDRGFKRSFYVIEELTEELRASEKAAYEKIIRILSHEVNNSVGAVASLLESARSYESGLREEDRADFRDALDVAVGRMQHLEAFMRGFADVVRLPSPDRHPCDLARLLDDILILFRPEMERRRIECVREEERDLPPIAMDKNQIEQVLVNVLKNSMESIGEDGRITIRLSAERGRPLLSVVDTGAGIAAEIRENLFTPFFSTKRNGRGLGLTVVREILARHRFEFSLEDRPEGGAEFTIRFLDRDSSGT